MSDQLNVDAKAFKITVDLPNDTEKHHTGKEAVHNNNSENNCRNTKHK